MERMKKNRQATPRSKNHLINIFSAVAVLYCFFSAGLSGGSIIQVEGEMTATATAYVKRWLSSHDGVSNLIYRMYFPESSTEGITTQMISNLRTNFIPYPSGLKEFTDEYGNTGVELYWQKEVRVVQLDLQFTAKSLSNYAPLTSESVFPMKLNEKMQNYLVSTDLSPVNDGPINRIGSTISEDTNKAIDVITMVFLWVDRNIRLMDACEYRDAPTVLRERAGNQRGICNLVVSIFKGLGIPARVMYGISYQSEVKLQTEIGNIVFDMPNGERYWVEVWLPDAGWVSYDPRGMYFGVIPHVIRISTGPDSDFISEGWIIENGQAEIQPEFLFDIKNDTADLQFRGMHSPEINKLVLSPPFSAIPDIPAVFELMKNENKQLQEASRPEKKIILVQNSDITKSLDKDATLERVYAQKISIENPVRISEVQLPLLKLADEGKIWVEVYSDDKSLPLKLLFRTFSIDSNRVRFMMVENPWLTFPVGAKTDSLLMPGTYWLMLRSSGSCLFHWYGSEGNVIGEKTDTIFREVGSKRLLWNNIMNLDMNFQLLGNRENPE
jgi:transglutaminase-like putative cysteine protease